jgi:hypothetical protein
MGIFTFNYDMLTVYRIKILLNKTNFRNVADYFADKKTEGNIQYNKINKGVHINLYNSTRCIGINSPGTLYLI